MKKIKQLAIVFTMVCMIYIPLSSKSTIVEASRTPTVNYSAHVQNIGWQAYMKNGQLAGTSGRGLRVESFRMNLSNLPVSGGISYATHVQNIGWQAPRTSNQIAGTTGQSLRMEAMRINLTGEIAKQYDVYYRTHVQNIGWMNWVKNGEIAGTSGRSLRMEAIEVKLIKKSKSPLKPIPPKPIPPKPIPPKPIPPKPIPPKPIPPKPIPPKPIPPKPIPPKPIPPKPIPPKPIPPKPIKTLVLVSKKNEGNLKNYDWRYGEDTWSITVQDGERTWITGYGGYESSVWTFINQSRKLSLQDANNTPKIDQYKAKYTYKVHVVSNYGKLITGDRAWLYIKTNNPSPKTLLMRAGDKNGYSGVYYVNPIKFSDVNYKTINNNETEFIKVEGGYITCINLYDTSSVHTLEIWESSNESITKKLDNYIYFEPEYANSVGQKVVNQKMISSLPGANDAFSDLWMDKLLSKITKPSMNTMQKLEAIEEWMHENIKYPTNDGKHLINLFSERAKPNDTLRLDSIGAPSLMHSFALKLGVPKENIVRGYHSTDKTADIHHSQIRITVDGMTNTFNPTPYTETGTIDKDKIKQFDFSIYK